MTKTKTATPPQFRSSLTYTPDEVKSVLEAKIQEEEAIAQRSATAAALAYEEQLLGRVSSRPGAVRVVSLFSGAGGLDLGAKLAAVSCAVGHERAYELLKDAPARMRRLGALILCTRTTCMRLRMRVMSGILAGLW